MSLPCACADGRRVLEDNGASTMKMAPCVSVTVPGCPVCHTHSDLQLSPVVGRFGLQHPAGVIDQLWSGVSVEIVMEILDQSLVGLTNISFPGYLCSRIRNRIL